MLSLSDIQSCFNNNHFAFIENLARESKKITQQYFGRTISLYAPLYLSNYCSSHCTYCGFSRQNRIKRYKLTDQQMQEEMACVAQKGIKTILLLTGESYQATPISYLEKSISRAKNFFDNIAIEIHPLTEKEYQKLFIQGVDGLTIYQETYNQKKYNEIHLSGKKKNYQYRRQTPFRAAQAGIRNISLGVLLGLSDASEDIFALHQHLKELEKSFPGVEYSLSFPRLQTVQGKKISENYVDDKTLFKIICLTRLAFPRVGINLSTRESALFRNHAIEWGVTRISAESSTSVGGYSLNTMDEKNPQFDINDNRSVEDIKNFLAERNFDPVFTDWRRISP